MNSKLYIDLLGFKNGKAYGFQEYILNILDYISEHREALNFNEIVVLCDKTQEIYFVKYSPAIITKTFKCKNIISRAFIQSLFPLFLCLKANDVILFPSNFSSIVKRCKHVLVIHDLLFRRKGLLPNNLMKFQRFLYLPVSIRLADKIIAISEFTKNDIIGYYPQSREKVLTIYNYFNFSKFKKVHVDLSNRKSFISVCSTAKHKNSITVFKAFKEYCLKGGTFNLYFVGKIIPDTTLYDFYLGLNDDIKSRISFYAHISNEKLGELYSKSSAYISASLFEGLGMPVVEALYFDLPVILSNLAVHHEITNNNGYYFDPLDYTELASLMLKIENNKCDFSYPSNLLQKYSEPNTTQQYINLLNNL